MLLSKEGRAEWDRLAGLLEGERRLTLSDGPMLDGAAAAKDAVVTLRTKLKGRGMPPDLWLRTKTAERIQWDTYRKFVNDLCLSAGTRAKASTGDKPKASRIHAFQGRKAKGRAATTAS